MGAVYKAEQTKMSRLCAIKILSASFASDRDALARFNREAQMSSKFDHPHAVTIYDFGEAEGGLHYLAMEFVEGEMLSTILRREGALPVERVLHLARQAGAALESAHRTSIVHRDLKPDNIFLVRDEHGFEHVKVLDFGIAKLRTSETGTASLTEMGTIKGTPYYMSPEQCQGLPLDHRSDIYSLGIMLFEMVTGNVPFRDQNSVRVLMMHTQTPPPSPRDARPDLPEAAANVILRALGKAPDVRQVSVGELALHFEYALTGRPLPVGATATIPVARATGEKHAPVDPTAETLANDHPSEVNPEAETRPVRPGRGMRDSVTRPDTALADTVPPSRPGVDVSFSSLDEKGGRKWVLPLVAVVVLAVLGGGGWFAMKGFGPPPPTANVAKPPADMILVMGGEFAMGLNSSEDPSEKPEHKVAIKTFLLDRFEVTNEQYLEFVKATGHAAPPGWKGYSFPPGEGKYPVTTVSWDDAADYAAWAKKRLPTEAEWEYAARGGEGRMYPWGNEFAPQKANTREMRKNGPMPVGSYEDGANRWGIYDLAGNVSEWTASEYKLYPGSKAKEISGQKVVRGGSFVANQVYARGTTRVPLPPATRDSSIGFRCAKDMP
jgi:serine/threonine-protein kinase